MRILILADIFGIESIPTELITKDTFILEPYKINKSVTNETLLYNAFIEKSGHDNYFQIAYKKTIELKPDIVIGFSIGGSIAWRLSNFKISSKIICFYPSQIRNHLDIVPKVKTTIVFPKKELHFDLNRVKEKLTSKKNVNLQNSTELHGFMNKKSINYNKDEKFKFIKNILNNFYK
ncbi:dienelactone hydrolase family protein [Arcobacter sp. LA11]|uniref:dienelactone hydrolase family protein n=1 Tax=Arcobacter sp. LA11 TaxID=1898176 RepID=UPI0009322ECF|nr:dienelactone hydrolase family protein [Arcobacter sp. LA11]